MSLADLVPVILKCQADAPKAPYDKTTYNRAWREAHKAHISAYGKKWRAARRARKAKKP